MRRAHQQGCPGSSASATSDREGGATILDALHGAGLVDEAFVTR